jgi:hypothetical protein
MTTYMGLRSDPERAAAQAEFRHRLGLALLEAQVPRTLHYGLTEYVVARQQPGHFLMAVLTNDLAEACARADDDNRVQLHAIVSFLHNHVTAECWGSPQKVAQWLVNPDPPDFIVD